MYLSRQDRLKLEVWTIEVRQDPYVVDGSKARIILAVLVAPAELMEDRVALDLLWHIRFRWHL